MKPVMHVAASAALGMALAPWTGWAGAGACVAAGTLIDIDHAFDFYREGRRWRGRRDFSDFFYRHRMRRLVLPLHGWEWAALGAAALAAPPGLRPGFAAAWMGVLWAAWAGATFHLLCDSLTNPLPARGYFFFWRARHGFLVPRMMPAAPAEPAAGAIEAIPPHLNFSGKSNRAKAR